MVKAEARVIINNMLLELALEYDVAEKEQAKKRLNERYKAFMIALNAIDKQIQAANLVLPCTCPYCGSYLGGDDEK